MARRKTGDNPSVELWGVGAVQLDPKTARFVGIDAVRYKRWKRDYSGIDLDRELIDAANWCVDAGSKGRKRSYARFISNWLRRAHARTETERQQREGGRSSQWL